MSEKTVERVARWLPLLISLAANAVLFGVFYGRTTEQIATLKESDANLRAEVMPMAQRLAVFVPRVEFVPVVEALRSDVGELKRIAKETQSTIRENNERILALYQLQVLKKGTNGD